MARRGHCCRCSCNIEPVFADGPPQSFSPSAPLPEAAVAIAADLIRAMPAVIDGTTPQTSEMKVCADGIGCGTLSSVIAPPVPTETYNAGYQMVQVDRGPGRTPRFVWERQNFTGTIPTTAIWTWPSNSWNIALNGQSRRTTRPELSLLVHRDQQSLATAASFYKRAPAFNVPPSTPIDLIASESAPAYAQKWFTNDALDGFQSNENEPGRFYFPLAPVTRKAAIQKVDIYWRPMDVVSIPAGVQLPEQGKWGVVYVTDDDTIYRWNEDDEYEAVDATLDPSGTLLWSVTNPNQNLLNGTFLSSEISTATNEEGTYFAWLTMAESTSRNFFHPVSFVVDRTPPLATLTQARDYFADEAGFANVAEPLSLTLEATEPCGIGGAISVQPASLAAGDHTRQLQGGPYRDRAGNDLARTPSAAFTVHQKPTDDRYGAIATFELPPASPPELMLPKTLLYKSGVTRLVLRFDRPVVGITAENILIEKVVGPDWERTALDPEGTEENPADYEVTLGNSRQEWIVTIFEEQPPNSLWYATFKPIRNGDNAPNVFVVPPGIEHLATPPTATNYGAVYWNADEKKDYVFIEGDELVEATPESLAAFPGRQVVDELPAQGNCRTIYEMRETGARHLFLGGSYVTGDLRDTSRPLTYQRTVANVGLLPLVGHPDTTYFTSPGVLYWSDRGGTAANYAVDSIALRQLYGISEPCRLAARATWIVLPEAGKNAEPADVRVSRIGTIRDVSSVSATVNESLHADFIDADEDGENAPTRDVSVSSTNGLAPRFDLPPEYSANSAAGFLPRVPPSATDAEAAAGRFSYWGLETTIYPSPPAIVEECSPPVEPQRHSSAIFSAGTITSLEFSFRTTVEWANVAQVQAGINALTTSIPEYTPCPCTNCDATGKLPAVPCTLCEATGKIAVCVEFKDGECVQFDIVNCPQCGGDGNQVDAQDCPQCGGDGIDLCLGYNTVTGGGGFDLNDYIAYLANPPLKSWSGVYPNCGPSPYPAAKDSYMAEVFPGRTPPPYRIGEVTPEPFTVNASPSEPQNTWTATNLSATARRNFAEYLPLRTTVVDGLVLRADGREPYETESELCVGDPPEMGGSFQQLKTVSEDASGNLISANPFQPNPFNDQYLIKSYPFDGTCASPAPTYLRKNSDGEYEDWTPTILPFPSPCEDQRGVSGVVYGPVNAPLFVPVRFNSLNQWVWIDSGTRGSEPIGGKIITKSRGFHAWAIEEQLTRGQEETLANGGTVEWLEHQELRRAWGKDFFGFYLPGPLAFAPPFDDRPNTPENAPFRNAEAYAKENLRFAVNYYVSVTATIAAS